MSIAVNFPEELQMLGMQNQMYYCVQSTYSARAPLFAELILPS